MLYDWLTKNIGPIADILLYIFIFYVILGSIYMYFNKDHVLNNWDKYRCKPSVLPISGFIKKEEGQGILASTYLNFNGCFWIVIKQYFNILIRPILYIVDIFKKLLNTLLKQMDVVRAQMKVMRNLVFGIVMGMMKKLENIMTAATFSYSKINEVMKRQLAVYQNVLYLMQTVGVTMNGFISGAMGTILDFAEVGIWVLPIFTLGPAGAIFPAMAYCFHPNTIINRIPISDIELGQTIDNNSTVISKMKFRMKKDMGVYDYNGTIVSGWHYVNENNDWIKVGDSKIAQPIKLDTDVLYSLNTTNNQIRIGNTLFRDYDEKAISEEANSLILSILNNNLPQNPLLDNKRYRFGFAKDTIIGGKKIQDLDLDDKILGVVEHKCIGDERFFRINDIICSEYVKIFNNNRWINVRDIGKEVEYSDNYYHIVTGDHTISIGEMVFRDFIEVGNVKDLEIVDALYSL
jgi:hypothetical protein